ncbi:DUF1330 domain-containing protein [Salinibacterium sp. SYSU T00001]|uniref:DUF1330 domain-containing protein n=1 Tax=Homoserinimonas sedimenticola TaxID=2986805 RepID=UPI002235BF4D|nr:DUF1330 domain-containing protein [Salinibacterium sedimenticola]MCW4386248.1 DUF1330 domain-containing protein [Salinibacterium sedimenticola]
MGEPTLDDEQETRMAHLEIRPDVLRSALESIPDDTPFLMLNLLRFREKAHYDAESSELSGREAYALYGKHAREYLTRIGAEVVVMGAAHGTVIGPAEEDWHTVMFVRYPSIAAFVAMANDPEYARIAVHREAALEDSRLIPVVA